MDLHLWAKQKRFWKSKSPTVTFQGGAGSGKTRAGCAKALVTALGHPGSRGMIVSASYPAMKQAIMPHLEAVAEEIGVRTSWQYNRADNQITLSNGSLIWLRSADNPESLLGADLAWVWGDEVGLWKQDAYRYLTSRLRQPGFPHQAFFTFTPKGRNWAWEELGQERDGLEVIVATSLENPFVADDFRERLRREYGEGSVWWRQEVLGEFVAFEGLIYPRFSVEACVQELPSGLVFVRLVAGVDWGWTNPGVILLLGLTAAGEVWALDEVYDRQQPPEWWIEQAQELQARWSDAGRIDKFLCDPSEPGNIDAWRKSGLPAVRANNEVIPGIAVVNGLIMAGRLKVRAVCQNTISELGMYSWKQARGGEIRNDEPEKVHDHAMDGLRYGAMGLINVAPHVPMQFGRAQNRR